MRHHPPRTRLIEKCVSRRNMCYKPRIYWRILTFALRNRLLQSVIRGVAPPGLTFDFSTFPGFRTDASLSVLHACATLYCPSGAGSWSQASLRTNVSDIWPHPGTAELKAKAKDGSMRHCSLRRKLPMSACNSVTRPVFVDDF